LIEALSANDPSFSKRLKSMTSSSVSAVVVNKSQNEFYPVHKPDEYYRMAEDEDNNYSQISRSAEPPSFAEALRLVRVGNEELPKSLTSLVDAAVEFPTVKVEEDESSYLRSDVNYYHDGPIY
jgi:hypothetical protein